MSNTMFLNDIEQNLENFRRSFDPFFEGFHTPSRQIGRGTPMERNGALRRPLRSAGPMTLSTFG
jgi:hypothetical protein